MIFERTFSAGSADNARTCTLTIGDFRTRSNGDWEAEVEIRGLFADDWRAVAVGTDALQALLLGIRIARAKLEAAPEFDVGELRWHGHPGHGLDLIAR